MTRPLIHSRSSPGAPQADDPTALLEQQFPMMMEDDDADDDEEDELEEEGESREHGWMCAWPLPKLNSDDPLPPEAAQAAASPAAERAKRAAAARQAAAAEQAAGAQAGPPPPCEAGQLRREGGLLSSGTPGLLLTTCGHAAHLSCWQTYMDGLLRRAPRRASSLGLRAPTKPAPRRGSAATTSP